jgi:hypothetical protein
MKTQRQTVLGLSLVAALGIAQRVRAQEPWVAPGNAPPEAALPPDPGPPSVPPPETRYIRSGTMTMDTGPTPNTFDHHVRPAERAFELQLGMGYGQGFGDIGSGLRDVHDISGAGGTIQATLGYRATPHFMFGVYGTGSQFARGGDTLSGTEVRTATAGLQADFHFRPSYVVDPWVSLSSGWR